MTNREKYKRAFSALESSNGRLMEAKDVTAFNKNMNLRKKITAAIVGALLVGVVGIAYAADIGGIRQAVQVWMKGERTDATLDYNPEDGSFTLSAKDGETVSGDAIAYDANGQERPMTESELLEEMDAAVTVEYKEDGSVWLYYYDQKIEITDRFQDGVCKTEVGSGDEKLYVTIEYKGNMSASSDGFVPAD